MTHHHDHPGSPPAVAMVHDEVCGMEIDPREAAAVTQWHGVTYHFCSQRCHDKFREHPDWYVPAP